MGLLKLLYERKYRKSLQPALDLDKLLDDIRRCSDDNISIGRLEDVGEDEVNAINIFDTEED